MSDRMISNVIFDAVQEIERLQRYESDRYSDVWGDIEDAKEAMDRLRLLLERTVERSEDRAFVGSRSQIASEWLTERFREKAEWRSDELFSRAREDGVSRNSIYEAKQSLNIPKAKKVTCENGDTAWVWWVPADWPHLSEVEEASF